MTEQVAHNIYRIGVELPGNPLRETNSYFVRGDDRDLLIDTGFRLEVCERALREGLEELGSDPARRDVLMTHFHADHGGLADLFVGPQRHIYVGRQDFDYRQKLAREESPEEYHLRFLSMGFSEEECQAVAQNAPSRLTRLLTEDPRITKLEDGDVLRVGEYQLTFVVCAGHTPGNAMLYDAKQGIMFSGDHILFDISPNITSWPFVEDSLGDYLENLRKADTYDVRQTLPGHRKTGDYHQRIAHLLTHHEKRLHEILEILNEQPDLTAYEIASRMRWRIRADSWDTFPINQKRFAAGECQAHLDYLLKRHQIVCSLQDGIFYYRCAPDTAV